MRIVAPIPKYAPKTEMDINGHKLTQRTEISRNGQKCTEIYRNGQKRIKTERNRQKRRDTDKGGD